MSDILTRMKRERRVAAVAFLLLLALLSLRVLAPDGPVAAPAPATFVEEPMP